MLIAGVSLGLLALVISAFTIALFLFYKHRKKYSSTPRPSNGNATGIPDAVVINATELPLASFVDDDLPRGRVLNKYVATDHTEISVDVGDVVDIVQTLDDGWFLVCFGRGAVLMCLNGQVGPKCNSDLNGDCAQRNLFKKVSCRETSR